MSFHRNAKLGLAGRYALVCAIEERDDAEGGRGRLQRVAGDGAPLVASLARVRARRRVRRCRACSIARAGRAARRGSSRRELAEAICACRRQTGWGPRLVAGATGFAHSTVWKVLKRGGHLAAAATGARSRPTATSGPAPATCCTWTPASTRASSGPATASPATARSQDRQHRDGLDIVHAIVDDHSRLAYAEIHDDEQAATVVGFLERASPSTPATASGQAPDDRQRLGLRTQPRPTTSCSQRHQIRHLKTKPYRPRTNGKVERFHQTMAREWAYGLVYRSHRRARRRLPHWLDHYNTRRPHSSLGGRPPISRVHNSVAGP